MHSLGAASLLCVALDSILDSSCGSSLSSNFSPMAIKNLQRGGCWAHTPPWGAVNSTLMEKGIFICPHRCSPELDNHYRQAKNLPTAAIGRCSVQKLAFARPHTYTAVRQNPPLFVRVGVKFGVKN